MISMKKIIPVLAVLGSAVAFAVYKMKKEEQKELVELDEGLLRDDEEEPSFQHTESVVHQPIQQEEEKEEAVTFLKPDEPVKETPIAKEIEPAFAPHTEMNEIHQVFEEAKKDMEIKEEVESNVPPIPKISPARKDLPKEEIVHPVEDSPKEEQIVEEVYSSEYPHLTNRMVEDINSMTLDAIAALAQDGDVHEHERPVQHMVSFHNKEDLEGFKGKVINKGFVITKGEAEFDLVVLHISPIDEEKLVNNILYLADQAYAFHGEYRGWQSKVSF